jgi:hypothetical protein
MENRDFRTQKGVIVWHPHIYFVFQSYKVPYQINSDTIMAKQSWLC